MIRTDNIHSLSEFQRNTSQHLKTMRETGRPEVLTLNGKAEIVVQSASSYQELLDRLELFESAMGARRGLADIEAGRSYTIDEFETQMQAKISKANLE